MKKLKGRAEIVFVAPSDGFFQAVASPRALVDSKFAQGVFTPYAQCFAPGTVLHVNALATKFDLSNSTIELSNGNVHQFDVVVLCTGRTYASPFRFAPGASTADRLGRLDEMREQIANSHQVVVVGGGASGVETAAEIKSHYPTKKVVLVHSKAQLLNTQHQVSAKAAASLLGKLQQLGVEVQLNTTFSEAHLPENSFVIWANKATPNTDFIPGQFLDKTGLVAADKFLRMAGTKNVFVAGDIVAGFSPNFKTAKMQHAPVVAANVVSMIDGKEPKKEVSKLPGFLDGFLLLALGEQHAFSVGLLGKMLEGGKKKDYMIERTAQEITKK